MFAPYVAMGAHGCAKLRALRREMVPDSLGVLNGITRVLLRERERRRARARFERATPRALKAEAGAVSGSRGAASGSGKSEETDSPEPPRGSSADTSILSQ